jgi:hypothetical protein
LGAGGPAGAGPPARPGGACGKPALFHLLFCASTTAEIEIATTQAKMNRFVISAPGSRS